MVAWYQLTKPRVVAPNREKKSEVQVEVCEISPAEVRPVLIPNRILHSVRLKLGVALAGRSHKARTLRLGWSRCALE
jgi:hypothetical protein